MAPLSGWQTQGKGGVTSDWCPCERNHVKFVLTLEKETVHSLLMLLAIHCREKEGLCHASLAALPVDSSSPLKRHTQTFIQTPPSPHSSDSLLSVNDGVVISRQDGTGWAVAMGTITKPVSDGEIEVLVDKTVPSDSASLYRIDAAPSHRGGAMAGNLADFCTSDSER